LSWYYLKRIARVLQNYGEGGTESKRPQGQTYLGKKGERQILTRKTIARGRTLSQSSVREDQKKIGRGLHLGVESGKATQGWINMKKERGRGVKVLHPCTPGEEMY